MIEFRWAVPDSTTTRPAMLQFRLLVACDASGAFCPGPPGEWRDVPLTVVQPPAESPIAAEIKAARDELATWPKERQDVARASAVAVPPTEGKP